MKKLLCLLIMGVILGSNTNAQIRLGLRGGINTAYFNATEVEAGDYNIEMINDASVGFHGGLMMQISFFGMFLQPELLFSSIGSEVRVTDLQQDVTMIREQNYNKLDIPVLVGKRFGPARVGVGPVGTIMLSSTSGLDEFGIQEQFNSATFGYQAGVGVDLFDLLALDLKYEGNLTRLGSGITVAGQEREFDSRSRQFIVSLGIFF